MVRSVWKGPYYEWSVMRKVQQLIASGIPQKEPIKVYSRRSMIVPQFIGYKFAIHNGRKFEPLEVRDVHLGKKFGDFSFTRAKPRSIYEKEEKAAAAAAKAAPKK